jgi:formylglycine-generating enzyme required for sulfatase activity
MVKLKPVFGIPPRKYVPVIWSVLLIVVIFFLLVLPGIRRNGTVFTIQSLPADASVEVDGIRLGTTGEKLFVDRGLRTLKVSRPGFQNSIQQIDVPGRIFASRLFPRRAAMVVELTPESGEDLFASGFREFAAWAATGPERERYAIPPTLTSTARNLLQSAADVDPRITSIALPHSLDERHLADILRSRYLLQSGGAPAGLSTLAVFFDDIRRQVIANPEILTGAMGLVESDRLEALGIEPSDQQDGMEELTSSADFNYNTTEILKVTRSYGGMEFVQIPSITAPIGDIEVVAGGYLPRSGATPAIVSVESFLVGALEVSRNRFMDFILANPEWNPENIDAITSLALADDGYLSGWKSDSTEMGFTPVTDVSWKAAAAYAEWFSRRYLAGTGLKATLPTEDQWEISGRLNGVAINTGDLPEGLKNVAEADQGRLGITGMAGNVREWCLNTYRYNDNLFRSRDGEPFFAAIEPVTGEIPEAPEKAVRGGAHIDRKLPYPVAVRGGLSPETTSPVIGFRLVLVTEQ